MKTIALTLALAAMATVGTAARAGDTGKLRPVFSCVLEDGSRATLKAESHGLEGDALFVQVGSKTERAFLDMPKSDFVGRIALSRCVGKTLVFALEYGTPYLKGVAIRQNPQTHAEERLYFAEKALPRWLYVGRKEMLVIIPNIGYETDKKYLVYRYVAGKGAPEDAMPADWLPVPKRDLIRMN
ncbi:hypothetical protein P3W85_18370 [Cupriavidus basilensis]|uniref:Uncharacterized protein n=1 Tax=Cupriavidus basilensis TaxID=68895 RepID=A0ABT6AQM5_9BURK|nr:hypothetical protein [Cupriavidus basilensis]MDF3834908.1 hypothetical protein [Cupriavidus basilensis]